MEDGVSFICEGTWLGQGVGCQSGGSALGGKASRIGGLSALRGMPCAQRVSVVLELFIIGVLGLCKTDGSFFITFTDYTSTHALIH